MEDNKITARTSTFQSNKNPISFLNSGLAITCGIPPPSVPAGHMYLQKYGGFTPPFDDKNAGSRITKSSKTTYFKYLKGLSIFLVLLVLVQALYIINPAQDRTDIISHKSAFRVQCQKALAILIHKMGSDVCHLSPPVMNQSDKHLMLPDRNNSSEQVRKRICFYL